MVYKPRKTVNGHKRNDRDTRRRKARAARKRALAARPVRSNIKRYVAEQFGKTHPDNRFYITYPVLKPTHKLDNTPRYYPFGASFQKAFLNMEFKRMKEVVAQSPALAPILGSTSMTNVEVANKKIGDHNHWKSILGRGIHMKHSSVYGTITLNEIVPLQMQNVLKYGNLKLHMFVLEDKAVTKTEFLNWYKSFLQTTSVNNQGGAVSSTAIPRDTPVLSEESKIFSASQGPQENGKYDEDLINVPYVAGSAYPASTARVCGDTTGDQNTRPKSGFDEFLIDWRKFYQTNESTAATANPVTDNPEHSLFYNEVKCTTDWDGTRFNSLLPVNKSRFIVHEHKTWSFKPRANGCVDTVIPFEYSFPEHYMHYDKELLDMPFVWNDSGVHLDDRGITADWMYPRKQPFIVFVYTCDNPIQVDAPTRVHDIDYSNGRANVNPPTTNSATDGTAFIVSAGGQPDSTQKVEPDLPANLHPEDEQKDGDLVMREVFPSTHTQDPWPNPPLWNEAVTASTTNVRSGEIFSIDMHFKCTYENKLATSIVPTINKGRPIIHKRESAPKRKRSRAPGSSSQSRKQAKIDKYFKITKGGVSKRQRTAGKVRRDAGPSDDWHVDLEAYKRAEAVRRGKDMRIASRRPTFDQMEYAEYKARQERVARSKARSEAIERGQMMRDGIRQNEIEKYKAALEHHGHTHASAKQMLRSVVKEALSAPSAVESGVMAIIGRYAGHSIPGSAAINQAFSATYNNPVFRDWLVGIMEDAGLPTNANTLKMALRIALRQRSVGGIDH